jgi:hypothetical protein
VNLRERGVNWATIFWFTLGVAQIIAGWGDDADMNQGLIFIVMALVSAGESRIEYKISELRYWVGELEYKNEQSERSRRLQQGQ